MSVVAELIVVGTKVWIKNKEYEVGDDEIILPDNGKGDAKVDAEGRLLGGGSLSRDVAHDKVAITNSSRSRQKVDATQSVFTPSPLTQLERVDIKIRSRFCVDVLRLSN